MSGLNTIFFTIIQSRSGHSRDPSRHYRDSYGQLLILYSWLRFAAVALAATALCIVSFPGWHPGVDLGEERISPFPSKNRTTTVLASSVLSFLLSLVSMSWQHAAALATVESVQDLASGTVKGKVGTTAIIVGWIAVGLLLVASVGFLVMMTVIESIERFAERCEASGRRE